GVEEWGNGVKAAQMTKTNAAGTLSSKSRNAVSSWTVRRDNCTVRRSPLADARKLRRSCWRRRRKVRRSLFRKVCSRSRPSHSGKAAVLLRLGRCQAIAPHSFATIEGRGAPQSILQPHQQSQVYRAFS